MEISGYPRPDGSVGFRNYVAILSSVGCANDVTLRLGRMYPNVLTLTQREGCAQMGEDKEQTTRALIGLGRNPNLAAVLVVGLGCESITSDFLAGEIAKSRKPVEHLIALEEGGLKPSLAKGTRILDRMIQEASQVKRVPCGLERLTLGIKCGLTDTTSGLSANPATGLAADRLIDAGGRVIFGETPEVIGAEHILARRAAGPEVKDKLFRLVAQCEERVRATGTDIRGANPSPGNIAGGISSIEEKSLGAIKKGGGKTLQGVLAYGEIPSGQGLFFMDGPGRTPEALTGLCACGAQVLIFPTGKGSPGGVPLAPVIKVTGNPRTAEFLAEHIDLDVSGLIKGQTSLEEAGERIFQELLAVASGKATRAEVLGFGGISIWTNGIHM